MLASDRVFYLSLIVPLNIVLDPSNRQLNRVDSRVLARALFWSTPPRMVVPDFRLICYRPCVCVENSVFFVLFCCVPLKPAP